MWDFEILPDMDFVAVGGRIMCFTNTSSWARAANLIHVIVMTRGWHLLFSKVKVICVGLSSEFVYKILAKPLGLDWHNLVNIQIMTIKRITLFIYQGQGSKFICVRCPNWWTCKQDAKLFSLISGLDCQTWYHAHHGNRMTLIILNVRCQTRKILSHCSYLQCWHLLLLIFLCNINFYSWIVVI